MTKNEVIEAVNKYNNSLNLTITSLEIDNTFVDDDLDTAVIVKLNLSDGTSEKIVWYDNKRNFGNFIEINGESMYYIGECYSYNRPFLLGNDWPEFYDDEEDDYIDFDELTDDEKICKLKQYVDLIDEDYIWDFIGEYENTKWWQDIVDDHTDNSDYDEIVD